MSHNPTATKIGHGLAKVLGIKLDYRNPTGADPITRGESTYSVSSADTYVEEEPTSLEWIQEVTPTAKEIGYYFYRLFPFLQWIGRYNTQWLIGDLIAGITIGAVVVPQGMAYATLANLPVEFGLYASFMGVLIYWFFATSKDITIGPVAVLSTVTGTVVNEIVAKYPQYKNTPWIPANALAVVAGGIVCGIGLLRLGWIVDFISLASISAFMTGSAINIAVGQISSLMGMSGFDSRANTYQVVISILTHLNSCKLDAALGLTALFLLYAIRSACNYGPRRFPKFKKTFFFANTLRTIFVILLYTLVSWLVNRNIPRIHEKALTKKLARFAILGEVPRGFTHAEVPQVTGSVVATFVGNLPSTVIVLIIEHISIAKSFGRVNNYTIDPSQEFVALGVTNLLAPFLGAYPATGSFSRTAIKAKAGVRTPLAGVITAIVVLIAIYGLTAVFFYIPSSALAAVIIHAVGDLITPPNTVYQFWRISPLEVIIFFAGVIVTVFTGIENGVYTTICVSLALYLFRAFKAKGRFLGRVKVRSVVGDQLKGDGKAFGPQANTDITRNVYLPIEHGDGTNPEVDVERPYPGVFIYRFSEGFNYPNANHYLDYLTEHIFANTRRTTSNTFEKPGDRPWNDPGPRRGKTEADKSHLPELKAVILDFSSVNNVDITSVQNLIDVRNQLDRWAAPNRVAWHFACINNRWTKRALASAGFGYPVPDAETDMSRWKPVFSVAEMGGQDSYAAEADRRQLEQLRRSVSRDPEHGIQRADNASSSSEGFDKGIEGSKPYTRVASRVAVIHGVNRPFFHIDITSALQSAISNVEQRDSHMVTDKHGTQDMDLFSKARTAPVAEEAGSSQNGA